MRDTAAAAAATATTTTGWVSKMQAELSGFLEQDFLQSNSLSMKQTTASEHWSIITGSTNGLALIKIVTLYEYVLRPFNWILSNGWHCSMQTLYQELILGPHAHIYVRVMPSTQVTQLQKELSSFYCDMSFQISNKFPIVKL